MSTITVDFLKFYLCMKKERKLLFYNDHSNNSRYLSLFLYLLHIYYYILLSSFCFLVFYLLLVFVFGDFVHL